MTSFAHRIGICLVCVLASLAACGGDDVAPLTCEQISTSVRDGLAVAPGPGSCMSDADCTTVPVELDCDDEGLGAYAIDYCPVVVAQADVDVALASLHGLARTLCPHIPSSPQCHELTQCAFTAARCVDAVCAR